MQDKIQKIINDFAQCADWEKKYEKLIHYGKNFNGLPDSEKSEDLKVKGCQSQVWIKAELVGDQILFQGDSDAILVKGLVAMVLMIYNNETPENILKNEPIFLKEIGLDTGLSPSRSNGLYSMIKQVRHYATAYQYLLSIKK